MENVSQLLIAPLFLLAEALFRMGFLKSLYVDIYGVDVSEIKKHNQARYEENTMTKEDLKESGVNEASGDNPVVEQAPKDD